MNTFYPLKKPAFTIKSLFLFLLILIFQTGFSQVTHTWNGSVSSDWSVGANWTPAGPPTNIDHVVIVAAVNNPILVANTTITNFTMTSGTLNLGGFTLNANGVQIFTAGTISNGNFASAGAVSSVFTNTTFAANCTLGINSGIITINGGTFNGTTSLNLNGTGNTIGTGNATFNGTTTLTNSGTGYFRANGGFTFNGTTELVVNASGYMLLENNTGSTYNGPLTLTLTGTATNDLRIAYNGTTNINNSLSFNNQSVMAVRFCEQAAAVANLSAGNTFTVGGSGFSSGNLILNRFNQLGATAQNITLTGTARMTINNSTFAGNLNCTSPEFSLSNTVYNGDVVFTKTGPTNNNTAGGNTFNQTLTVNHNGTTGYWSFGNGAADIYNGDVFSNNNSQDRIIFGHGSGGNQFNGHIILTQIGSSTGTALTWGAGTATIAATKTISIGGAGYSVGYLYTENVTQLGNAAINLTFTGSSSVYLGPSATFGGAVTITGPSIYARGATYNSPVVFTKNGATNDHNNGNQNIFNSTLEINQQGTGYFMLGYNSNDLFQEDITLTSTNTGGINLGWVNGTGTPTLAAGKTIAIGGTGYAQGYLRLGSFTQLGNAAINLNLNAADFYVENIPASTIIGGALTVTAANLYIEGGIFNGATSFTKTGTANNHNNGNQNIFNSTLEINQQGTGYLMLGYNSNDLFNDDITVTSTNTGIIYLGFSSGTGTPTLSAGNTIFVGGAGYALGHLYLGGFTQLGNAALNLPMGSAATLTFRASSIGGAVTSSSGGLFFSGTTFNSSVDFIKTGSTNDQSAGGNLFSQATTIENAGSGYLLTANGSPDTYQSSLLLRNSGSAQFYFAYNSTGNINNGSLTLENQGSATQIRVVENSSTLTINGATTITNSTAAVSSQIYFPILGTITQNGNLTASNTTTGDLGQIIFSNTAGSILTITGDLSVSNTATGINSNIYIGSAGSISVSGALTATNNSSGTTGEIYVANASTSLVTLSGTATFTNANAGTTKRIWIGNSGSVIFNGLLTMNNTSSATNSRIYCNYASPSANLYNQNIIVTNTNAAGQGISFGENNGAGTLAATRTITIGGGGFVAGNLSFRNFTQVGPTAQTLISTGTTLIENYNSNWGGNVDFRGARMFTRGTTYQGIAYLEKFGAIDDASVGGNIFQANTELRNSGSGYFLMGNGFADVFAADLLMNNTGTYRMYLAHNSAGNSIAGNFTVNNTGSSTENTFYLINTAISTLTIGGNVLLNNLSSATGATIYFPNDGTSTVAGDLTVVNNCSGTNAHVYLANSANTNLNVSGNTIITNSGAGTTKRTFVGTTGDITFNGTLSLLNNSTATNSEIYCNYNAGSVNSYNHNITVQNTNASSDGIRFGENNGSGTLAATRTITIGGGGFVAGNLSFRNFTQVGATAQTLITTGTTLFENYNSNWGGNVDFRGARMFTRGTTYQGTSYLEKFGAFDDASAGGNTFQGNSELRNSGSGYFLMGNGSPDVFVLDLLMNNTGTYRMYLAHSSAGNTIGGNFTINNTASLTENNIYLVNTAASTLAVAGNVIFNNLSTATSSTIYFPENGTATIGGDLTLLNNTTGTTGQIVIANAATTALTVGGNTIATNSGASTTKRTYLGNSGDLTFNGTLAIINNSSATNSEVFCNYGATSLNTYNQNITLENTNAAGDGIFFGNNGGAGTLAASRTVSLSGGGFVAGTLQFRNFTQLSATAQAITLTGVGTIFENFNSTWNGNVTFIAPRHFTRGTTYNGISFLEKNGATNDASVGANVFNANVEFLVSGTGYFMPANTSGNDYNANVTYTKTSSGLMYPDYNATSTYAGDITINSNAVITFADAGNGRVEFDGGNGQIISNSGAVANHIMRRITTNKSANDVTLNTPINVSANLNLVTGNINTSAANLIIMLAGSTVTSVSDASYVNGPVRKIGNTAFDFPVGKGGNYRAISISAPGNAAHHFTAEYFAADPNPSYDVTLKDPTLDHISRCEYWILDRTNGASNVFVTVSWDAASCGVTNLADLRVSRWNGAMWKDHGNGGTTGNTSSGTVMSSAALTAFSPITLASITTENPLPIELISFEGICSGNEIQLNWSTASESNNDYFTVEKSNDGIHWQELSQIPGAGNSSSVLNYQIRDINPHSGTNYYRLKQTDFNGLYDYSSPIAIHNCISDDQGTISIFPNPSNGIINVTSTFTDNYELQIVDLTGKTIYKSISIVNGTNQINLQDLSKGIYFLRFTVNGQNYFERIVLN